MRKRRPYKRDFLISFFNVVKRPLSFLFVSFFLQCPFSFKNIYQSRYHKLYSFSTACEVHMYLNNWEKKSNNFWLAWSRIIQQCNPIVTYNSWRATIKWTHVSVMTPSVRFHPNATSWDIGPSSKPSGGRMGTSADPPLGNNSVLLVG